MRDLSKLSVQIGSEGIIEIDLIRSYLSPGRIYLLNLLKKLENGLEGYELSDECDEWWDKLECEIASFLQTEVDKVNMYVFLGDLPRNPKVSTGSSFSTLLFLITFSRNFISRCNSFLYFSCVMKFLGELFGVL